MRQKIESHFGLIIALIAIIGLLSQNLSSPKTEYNSILMEQNIGGLKAGDTVKIKDLTPFDWEDMYLFDSSKSKADIEEILGFSSNSVRSSVSEGMIQLLFVNGEEIAGSECAYPDRIGYTVDLKGKEKVTSAEDPEFIVSVEEGITVLTLAD